MWSRSLGKLTLVTILCARFASSQNHSAAPAFEVATVKPVDPRMATQLQQYSFRGGMSIDKARVDIRRMSIAELIRTAYEVKGYQVAGPNWINIARFDVAAKMPEGSAKEQVPAMLKTLLTERFKLRVHTEKREHPVYSLIVGKNGPKLKPAALEPARATDSPAVKTSVDANDVQHLEFLRITVPALAEVLERYADRPVIDETGLEGYYQVVLDISLQELRMRAGFRPPPGSEPAASASDPGGDSLFNTVQRLGLKLKPKTEPVDTIVVDQVEKMPTEN